MKKIKLLGFIAILAVICLSMASCDAFGGSLEIRNNTGGTITASAISITNVSAAVPVTIENGKSKTWNFSVDGDVTYSWNGTDIATNIDKGESLVKVTISGGEKKVITAKDQKLD